MEINKKDIIRILKKNKFSISLCIWGILCSLLGIFFAIAFMIAIIVLITIDEFNIFSKKGESNAKNNN